MTERKSKRMKFKRDDKYINEANTHRRLTSLLQLDINVKPTILLNLRSYRYNKIEKKRFFKSKKLQNMAYVIT